MPDLKELCNQLRSLGEQPPTEDSRAAVEAALGSKWWGVQVVAAKVLAKWADDRSIEQVKAWTVDCLFNRNFAMITPACRIMATCIRPDDAEWLLDVYIPKAFTLNQFTLWESLRQMPLERVEKRLIQESKSLDRVRRLAALLASVGLGQYPLTHDLIQRFTLDPDPVVEREARWWLRHLSGTAYQTVTAVPQKTKPKRSSRT